MVLLTVGSIGRRRKGSAGRGHCDKHRVPFLCRGRMIGISSVRLGGSLWAVGGAVGGGGGGTIGIFRNTVFWGRQGYF